MCEYKRNKVFFNQEVLSLFKKNSCLLYLFSSDIELNNIINNMLLIQGTSDCLTTAYSGYLYLMSLCFDS